MTKGIHLRIYTYEDRRIHGELQYEWLLAQAQALGIPGGTAFRAISGYGRHGHLHEQAFFELAGEQPVVVEVIADAEACEGLLARIRREGLALFHVTTPVEYDSTMPPGESQAPT